MSLLLMAVVLPRATHHPGDYSETTLGSMLRQLRMQLELLNCFLMTIGGKLCTLESVAQTLESVVTLVKDMNSYNTCLSVVGYTTYRCEKTWFITLVNGVMTHRKQAKQESCAIAKMTARCALYK